MIEIVNFLLYAFLLRLLIKKRKNKFAIFVTSIWAGSALLGIFYARSESLREGLHEISLEPFLYLFFCFCISVYPFISQKETIHKVTFNNESLLFAFCKFIAILAIYPFCEGLYQMIDLVVSGRFLLLGANYDDFANGYIESLVSYSKIGIYTSRVLFWFKVLTPVLLFYYLQKKERNKYVIIGLVMASLVPALQNMSIGSKTELIFLLLYYLGLFIYLKDIFDKRIKKKLYAFLGVLMGVIITASIAISIGRYVVGDRYSSSDGSTFDFLFMYSSESMYNFNQNAYYETVTLNGLETSQSLLLQLGLTDVSMENRRFYIGQIIKSPSHLFYNFIGDIYLDAGWFLTIVIIILLAFIFKRVKKRRVMLLSDLSLVSLYIYLLSNGLFYFCFKMSYVPILTNIVFYFISRQIEILEYKKNISTI